jgi:hypothetical protein
LPTAKERSRYTANRLSRDDGGERDGGVQLHRPSADPRAEDIVLDLLIDDDEREVDRPSPAEIRAATSSGTRAPRYVPTTGMNCEMTPCQIASGTTYGTPSTTKTTKAQTLLTRESSSLE